MTAELEKALAAADAAGNTEDAKYFANELRSLSGKQTAPAQQSVAPIPDEETRLANVAEAGSMAAKDMSGGQSFLVGAGRGASDVAQGVKQLSLQHDVKWLERMSTDPMATYMEPTTGQIVRVGPNKREEYKAQFEAKKIELDDYVGEKTRELELFEAGSAERPLSMIGGRMVGGAAAVPIPGITFGNIAARLAGEGVIGASVAGMEFVPEGESRKNNMLISGVLSGGMSGVLEIVKSLRKTDIVDSRAAEELADKLEMWDSTAPPSLIKEESDLIAEVAKDRFPELSDEVDGLLQADNKLIRDTLSDLTDEEFNALTAAQKDALFVAKEMNTKLTKGQMTRDPFQMQDEIRIAGADGNDLYKLLNIDQLQAGVKKYDEVIGREAKSEFGEKLQAAVKDIDKRESLIESTLWDEATARSIDADPMLRFSLDGMEGKMWDANLLGGMDSGDLSKVNAATDNIVNYIKRRWGNNPETIEAFKVIDMDAKQTLSGAEQKLYRLTKYIEQVGGIDAEDSNQIRRIINQDYGRANPSNKRGLDVMRQGLIADTVDGLGEDVFEQARKFSADRHSFAKQFPILEKMGLGSDEMSPDEVFKKLFKKANQKEFNETIDLLISPRLADNFKPVVDSLRQELFANIERQSFKRNGELDVTAMHNYLFGKNGIGEERLARVMEPEELLALKTIIKFDDITKVPKMRRPSGSPTFEKFVNYFSRKPGTGLFAMALNRADSMRSDELLSAADKPTLRAFEQGKDVSGQLAEQARMRAMQGQGMQSTLQQGAQAVRSVAGRGAQLGVARGSSEPETQNQDLIKALVRSQRGPR